MRIIFTLPLLFLCFCSFAQISTTIHKTYKIDEVQTINVESEHQLNVEQWTGSRLLVETTISLEGANKRVLEHLIEIGRYNLTDETQGDVLMLDLKGFKKKVKVQDSEIYEDVRLKLFVPEGVQVVQR